MRLARLGAVAALVVLLPVTLRAQDTGWAGTLAASASLFFGASSQRLVATSASLARADSGLSLSNSVQFRYGEASEANGTRFVNARAWLASSSLDLVPTARLTPFVFATVESSLEKRIASRLSSGAGAKRVLTRSPAGEASLSLALLGEWTRPLEPTMELSTRLLRWSSRAKFKRKLQERLTVSHTTYYQPEVSAVHRFTLTSLTEAAYAMTDAIAVTFSLADSYDSEARRRGALDNNDGQLLVGLQSKF